MFVYSCSSFLLPCWLPGDPRPFPNERSLNSHILCGLNLLIGQDLTHFYLTQSLGMHLFKRSTISARCVMKESPLEKREGSFGSVLVTDSMGPLSFDHFSCFRWCSSCTKPGNRTDGWLHYIKIASKSTKVDVHTEGIRFI